MQPHHVLCNLAPALSAEIHPLGHSPTVTVSSFRGAIDAVFIEFDAPHRGGGRRQPPCVQSPLPSVTPVSQRTSGRYSLSICTRRSLQPARVFWRLDNGQTGFFIFVEIFNIFMSPLRRHIFVCFFGKRGVFRPDPYSAWMKYVVCPHLYIP